MLLLANKKKREEEKTYQSRVFFSAHIMKIDVLNVTRAVFPDFLFSLPSYFSIKIFFNIKVSCYYRIINYQDLPKNTNIKFQINYIFFDDFCCNFRLHTHLLLGSRNAQKKNYKWRKWADCSKWTNAHCTLPSLIRTYNL